MKKMELLRNRARPFHRKPPQKARDEKGGPAGISHSGLLSILLPGLTLLLLLPSCPSASMERPGMDPAAVPILDGHFSTAVVIDAATGEVLVAKEPHKLGQPASMVKMMTELLILEAIAEGAISLSESVTVSAKASRMGGSQVYLKEGETFTVEELLMALAIHSANDAAVTVAEYHSGSTEAFVDLMNLRAEELGMRNTVFRTVHGLPPGRGQKPDLASAYDMAVLGCSLVKYPEALRWASTETAPFRSGKFTLYNPNKLVGKYRGLDGLKTGYHRKAGFCVTASATQKGRRLIAVIMGATTSEVRATQTTRLLSYGFNLYTQLILVAQERQPLEHNLRVKGGKARDVAIAYAEPLTVSVRKDRTDQVILEERLADKLTAPVDAGQVVGKAVATLDGRPLGEVPIIAVEAVAKGSFLDQLLR